MKRKLNQFMAVILSAVMLIIPAPFAAFEAEAAADDFSYYHYNDSAKTTILRRVSETVSGDVVIPEAVDGYTVIGIAEMAFGSNKAITSLTLPASIKYCEGIFSSNGLEYIAVDEDNPYFTAVDGVLYSNDLRTLVLYPAAKGNSFKIPAFVETLGNRAFSAAGFESITIPGSVKNIGYGALAGCESLTDVEIKNGVEKISAYAFSGCHALTHIAVPDSVKGIFRNAFYCENLTSITLGSGIEFIDENPFSQTAYYKDKTNWVDGAFYIGDYLLNVDSSIKELESYAVKPGTKFIGAPVFYGWEKIKTITIPASVEHIMTALSEEEYGLASYSYPLYACRWLKAFVVDSANAAFSSENGVLFNKDKTELILFPQGKNNEMSYTVPSTVKKIAPCAFSDVINLNYVSLPYGLKEIGVSAFDDCENLDTINIPITVKSIGAHAFDGIYGLEYIFLPEGVEAIGEKAFANSGLNKIAIPASVTEIGPNAFDACQYLTDVYYAGSQVDWSNIKKAKNSSLESVNVHYGSTAEHTHVFAWEQYYGQDCQTKGKVKLSCSGCNELIFEDEFYTNFCTFGDWVPSADKEGALERSCSVCGLKYYYDEYFDDAVNTSGPYTEGYFTYTVTGNGITITACDKNAKGIVEIPQTLGGFKVEAIAELAFDGCRYVTEIVVPDTVISIATKAFYSCDSLEAVTVSDLNQNYTSVDGVLLSKDMATLKYFPIKKTADKYTVPEGVKDIAPLAFWGCKGINAIVLPSTLKTIGYEAFYGCSNISGTVSIPVGVESIGYCAFENCSKINKLYLPKTLKSIGANAFYGCSGLTGVYYASSYGNWVYTQITGNAGLPDGIISYNTCYKHNYVYSENKEPTCTAYGGVTAVCSECDRSYRDETPPLGHDYQTVECTWYEGRYPWTASIVLTDCTRCSSSSRSESATVTQVKIPATCEEAGCHKYIATIEYNGKTYTAERVSNVYGPHQYEPVSWTWEENYESVVAHCVCKLDESHTLDVKTYAIGCYEMVEPTAEEDGYYDLYASANCAGNTYDSPDMRVTIPKLSEKTLMYIVVEEAPDVYKYFKDTPVNTGGMQVIAYYNDGWVDITDKVTVTGFDTATAGERTATVEFEGKTDTFDYTVVDARVRTISVIGLPLNRKYAYKQPISLEGLQVLAAYKNGDTIDTVDVTALVTIEDFDTNIIGKRTATVKYAGLSDTFGYTVVEESLERIEITALPTTKTYTQKTPVSTEGLQVIAYYNNGEEIDVTDRANITGFDSDTVGERTATVEFEGAQDSFTYTVVEAKVESVEVVKAPSTFNYSYKAAVSTDGLQVIAHYNNGDKVDVTNDVAVKNFDTNSTGTKTATVEFENKTAEFEYTVSYTWWQWLIRILLLGIFWY